MTLEALANELLLELFKFLEAVDLYRAFHGLNNRFNTLLLTESRPYHVNFHSVLKYQSDFLVQRYIPSIANEIISLRLSDNIDESLPQTDFFFSYGLRLYQFTHLRSLSLCYIDDKEILRKLIVDCHQLPYLTHLKVVRCLRKHTGFVDFSNIIWGLPKLTHCYLQMEGHFHIPTVVSLSLEYLSISCWLRWPSQAAELFQQMPNLYRLHVPLIGQGDNSTITLPSILSITTLRLSDVRSLHVMNSTLLIMPNLIHLKVDTQYNICDGYRWEEIIDKHLPKLKVFHLRMHFHFYGTDKNEQHAVKLVDSFRTRFWFEKHQWYIRCHYPLKYSGRSTLLYTIPYAFRHIDVNMLTMPCKSTCPQDTDYYSYDKVNYLNYDSPLVTDYFSLIQFPNIRNLHINLPINKYFWRIIPTFHQLNSLTVLSANENAQFYLQLLLDRAPYLYSLTIHPWPASERSVVQNSNKSVRRLDIRQHRRWSDSSFFSREQCNTFIHSPLAMQCEELLIRVKNRKSILDLINNMVNLRILFIEYLLCPEPVFTPIQYTKKNHVFINWLQDQLPATCILSKSRSLYNMSLLWIYLKKP